MIPQDNPDFRFTDSVQKYLEINGCLIKDQYVGISAESEFEVGFTDKILSE
jgi:hypothetical protein